MSDLETQVAQAREALDAHTVKMVEWHFNPETGSPFWLEQAADLDFDRRPGFGRLQFPYR